MDKRLELTQAALQFLRLAKESYLKGETIFVAEMTEHCHISRGYGYQLLKRVAEELQIDYKELLRRPKEFYERNSYLTSQERITLKELSSFSDELSGKIQCSIQEMEDVMAKEEAM